MCGELKKRAATQPLVSLPGLKAVIGDRQRRPLSEPQFRRPCCSSPPHVFLSSISAVLPLLLNLDATLLAHDSFTRFPQRHYRVHLGPKTTHFFSPEGSRRKSFVLSWPCGRQRGSLCSVGRILTKLPQSALTL